MSKTFLKCEALIPQRTRDASRDALHLSILCRILVYRNLHEAVHNTDGQPHICFTDGPLSGALRLLYLRSHPRLRQKLRF